MCLKHRIPCHIPFQHGWKASFALENQSQTEGKVTIVTYVAKSKSNSFKLKLNRKSNSSWFSDYCYEKLLLKHDKIDTQKKSLGYMWYSHWPVHVQNMKTHSW
jgi:hypothetical protein